MYEGEDSAAGDVEFAAGNAAPATLRVQSDLAREVLQHIGITNCQTR